MYAIRSYYGTLKQTVADKDKRIAELTKAKTELQADLKTAADQLQAANAKQVETESAIDNP